MDGLAQAPLSRFFPFHRLGLRCNPFRALTDDEWAELALLPDGFWPAFNANAAHWQVIGEAGHGKSTLLLGLARRLREAGLRVAYERVPENARRYHTPIEGLHVFLLDEAQRLSAGEQRRLLRAAAAGTRLVASTHADLAPLFARARLPLDTVRLEALSLERLLQIVDRRLAYFALPGGPGVRLSPEAAAHLLAACGANLRQMERWLYEAVQVMPSPGAITVEALEEVRPKAQGVK